MVQVRHVSIIHKEVRLHSGVTNLKSFSIKSKIIGKRKIKGVNEEYKGKKMHILR